MSRTRLHLATCPNKCGMTVYHCECDVFAGADHPADEPCMNCRLAEQVSSMFDSVEDADDTDED